MQDKPQEEQIKKLISKSTGGTNQKAYFQKHIYHYDKTSENTNINTST
jgi:hypothetical protein